MMTFSFHFPHIFLVYWHPFCLRRRFRWRRGSTTWPTRSCWTCCLSSSRSPASTASTACCARATTRPTTTTISFTRPTTRWWLATVTRSWKGAPRGSCTTRRSAAAKLLFEKWAPTSFVLFENYICGDHIQTILWFCYFLEQKEIRRDEKRWWGKASCKPIFVIIFLLGRGGIVAWFSPDLQ